MLDIYPSKNFNKNQTIIFLTQLWQKRIKVQVKSITTVEPPINGHFIGRHFPTKPKNLKCYLIPIKNYF